MSYRLLSVTIKREEELKNLGRLPDKVRERMMLAAASASGYLFAEFKNLFNRKSPYTVGRRTGKLARSIHEVPAKRISGDRIVSGVEVGEGVPYAALHVGLSNRTETVVNASRLFMAIPIGGNLTAGGRARTLSPRDVPDLFRPGANSGKLSRGILYQRRPRSPLPMFLLLQSVTIPRRIFTDMFAKAHERAVQNIFEGELARLETDLKVVR